ncbi:hypothetical protein FRC04_007797 [Tulasnella sp. 424]|nr:hypothetical protein FRC04_007797 [Tulasnella sp. 424]KAG8975273.1 hypothetical protein FRC05_006216 [Tulasnella sp. 425]
MEGLLANLGIPDAHSRPLFNLFSLSDWMVVALPHAFLISTTKLAMTSPRDPISQATRLLLLPVGLYAYVYVVAFRDYAVAGPESNVRNYGVGLFNFAAALKLLEMSFTRTAPQRIPKSAPPKKLINGDAKAQSTYNQNGSSEPNATEAAGTTGSIKEVMEYLCDPRLLHYDATMARNSYDLETRDTTNRLSFLLSTILLYVTHVAFLDLFQTIVQSLPNPGLGTPGGGSIFNDSVSPPFRYLISSVAVLCAGGSVYCGLQAGHNIVTLIGVGLLGQDPSDYPPMFDKPWLSTSVRELWSKRWHLVLRVFFTTIGARVGGALLGDVGAVLGAFTLSGILHDWTIWGMGKGTDPLRIVGFFYVQGVAVILETVWRKLTGKRVEGWWGRVWTWSFMLVSSHLVVEAWLQRGIAGGTFFLPDEFRPFLQLRNLVFGK